MVSPKDALKTALKQAVADSKSPGAVAYVGNGNDTFLHAACGARQLTPKRLAAKKDTVYDLASLTKVVATTTAILLLRDEGRLDLDQAAGDHIPLALFKRFTIRHLLTHTAGLVAGKPYYTSSSSIDEMLQRYASLGLSSEPGAYRRYSDVGFMILGKIVELAAHERLDRFCAKRIFGPLGMTETCFNPPSDLAARCAATERCAWRKRVVVGKVHDENAYAVGGVSGHAGLFSTAGDLARFCRAMLAGKILKPETVKEMGQFGQVPYYPWQGLGWQLDPWASKTMGFLPSRHAFGHTGWTGPSLWLDPEAGLFAVLLSNTCHPSRTDRDNETFRRVFYTAVADTLYPNKATTHTGLDRLVRERFYPVRDRRVALLTNHAAVDETGRHIVDVFALDPSNKLHLLYSPEHGIRGKAEAGAKVDSEAGSIPVISLYGKRKRPSKDELAEIDLFVVDLQDIGSRYYTYMATMKECMAACAAARKPMLILDRPNPLGGTVLEGPIAQKTGSDVCCAPIPIRHGMTMGELALFFLKQEFHTSKLKVMVNLLDNWDRTRLFDECALPWVPPSPNIPTAETALLYAGTCLFEGTNLNEGRGTDIPFHIVGAPWLDAEAIVDSISEEARPGCSLVAARYTPKSIPGKASNPRFRDEACEGVRIRVTDPHAVRPFTLTVELLRQIRKRHPNHFEWTPWFDTLAGSTDLRTWIENGDSGIAIAERIAPVLQAFAERRPLRYE